MAKFKVRPHQKDALKEIRKVEKKALVKGVKKEEKRPLPVR